VDFPSDIGWSDLLNEAIALQAPAEEVAAALTETGMTAAALLSDAGAALRIRSIMRGQTQDLPELREADDEMEKPEAVPQPHSR
jgi:hypothetical protein